LGDLASFLPWLISNCALPDFWSSWDYRLEPLCMDT
jgi:hypothetical protein